MSLISSTPVSLHKPLVPAASTTSSVPTTSTPPTDASTKSQTIPTETVNNSEPHSWSVAAFIDHYMDLKSLNPVAKSFLAGSISGTCSTILFQPLDLLKTRIQAPVGHGTTGIFTIAGNILRNEKWLGLWKGMTPSLTRTIPGVGLYFASIHGMKIIAGIEEHPTPIQAVVLGVTGRSLSGVILIPFTVIKTRFESKFYQYGSIREALKVIYRTEGIRGLTCGLLPTLLRDAPFSGLYLMLYTSAKQQVPVDWIESPTFGPYVRFSCGIGAGFAASLVTQPADVIKTKMQLYPHEFRTFFQVVPYVYKRYGLTGYFKGLVPRAARRTLVAAMSWTVYEQLMKSVGLK